jgi:hypothetical protein
MKWRSWMMSWFRQSDSRSRSATTRLRQVEEVERAATDRMVRAGVEVTIRADNASKEIGKLLQTLEKRNRESDRIFQTVEGALRLVERGQKR